MAGDTGKTTSNPSTYGGTWCCALNPPARSEISAFSTFWIPERDQCLMNEGIPQSAACRSGKTTLSSRWVLYFVSSIVVADELPPMCTPPTPRGNSARVPPSRTSLISLFWWSELVPVRASSNSRRASVARSEASVGFSQIYSRSASRTGNMISRNKAKHRWPRGLVVSVNCAELPSVRASIYTVALPASALRLDSSTRITWVFPVPRRP